MSRLQLARDVLDNELLDVDGTACGRVDNLELETDAKGALRIGAVLVGPAALTLRLPALLHQIVRLCGGTHQVRVRWSEVERVDGSVRLKRRASELGLGKLNRKIGRWVSRLPKS